MIGTVVPSVPFRAIVGNLAWTHDGTVWAIWRIDPLPYRYASDSDKVSYGRVIGNLLRSLRGEPLILSLCGRVDPRDAPASAVTQPHPIHREITDGYLRLLDDYELRDRTYWLALPLPHSSGWASASSIGASASSLVARSFGLTPPMPGVDEVRRRAEQAVRVARAAVGLVPATPDEILWIHRRAARKGTPTEPSLTRARRSRYAEATVRGRRLRSPSFAFLGQVHFDEGGRTDASSSGTRNPFQHRYLKVTTADGGTGYQAFLVLSDLPESWAFPGGEWLAALHEDTRFPVDWAIRATVNPGNEAKRKVTRKRRQLADQVGEFSAAENDDSPEVDALPSWVSVGQRQLAEEQAALDAHASEVEYEATVMLGVWGGTLDECEEYAEALRSSFSDELTAVRPTGDQLACYAAMLPGVTTPRVVSDYTQYLLADDLAKSMPFVGSRLGDQSGQILGLGIDAGTQAPVRLNLTDWTSRDISASIGLFAELGAGKSVTLKKILADIAADGGRTIGWDRTRTREQVTFLSAAFGADQVQVADLANPTSFSLDPLRVLRGPAAAQAAETFLSQLLGVEATSEQGTILAETIDKVIADERPSMAALLEALAAMSDAPAAAELHRQIRASARRPGTGVIFDPALPPLDTSADHIIFGTHGMTMPRRHELRSARQLAQLPFSALFGRAVLTLTAVLAKAIAFADSRFVLVHADECYWLTREGEGSPGYDTTLELIRDGRKNNAGLLLAGHDPEDTGNETLLGLLSAVFLGRQRNHQLATRYVRAIGITDTQLAASLTSVITSDLSPLTHTDPATGDMVVEPGREGEFIVRIHSRIGMVKVLEPPVERIRHAIRTTPTGNRP
ncbi:ATP-binding protein [Natronosporangium hydrolyticum]|uniref:ATP-binding protein n=1 Tax=Natronosporangium hydrolyticum TaxID=2811111 RepID=A0A895YBU7_9ACTN|nr:ATP-binding protein [Natronosporangium hydrolyticum]QSB14911.1 ATP-binding protein [Natronosporangium hydrolyticum]